MIFQKSLKNTGDRDANESGKVGASIAGAECEENCDFTVGLKIVTALGALETTVVSSLSQALDLSENHKIFLKCLT